MIHYSDVMLGMEAYGLICVEINCRLDATEVFIADLIACSTCFWHHYVHHQELKSIIQWLLPVVMYPQLHTRLAT